MSEKSVDDSNQSSSEPIFDSASGKESQPSEQNGTTNSKKLWFCCVNVGACESSHLVRRSKWFYAITFQFLMFWFMSVKQIT